MCGGFLGKIISVAAPIVGGIFGGPLGAAAGGALGSAVNGGSIGNDLLSAGISGLGSGIFSGLDPSSAVTTGVDGIDSINSGITSALSPVSSGLSDLGSSLGLTGSGDALTNLFSGAPSDVASDGLNVGQFYDGDVPSGAASLGDDAASGLSGGSSFGTPSDVSSAFSQAAGGAPSLDSSGIDSMLASAPGSSASGSGGILNNLVNKISSNPLQALTLAGLVAQNALPAKGSLSAGKALGIAQNQQQSQANTASNFVNSLNGASLNRTPVNPGLSTQDYYTYGSRPEQLFYSNQTTPIPFQTGTQVPAFAGGGYVRGGSPLSGGQDDDIDAKLSNGEYVIPADVVSGLGDGVNDVGAKKLDGFLDTVRSHRLGTKQYPKKAKDVHQYLGMKRGGKIKKKSGGSVGTYTASEPMREMHFQTYGRI